MGQYHFLCNLDKKEFVHPHKLGSGLKVREQMGSSGGTSSAVIALICCPEVRGGGDLEEGEYMGRWHGDRIALVGDYAEDKDLREEDEAGSIYDKCWKGEGWTDISVGVREMLARELGLEYAPPDYDPENWDTWLRRKVSW